MSLNALRSDYNPKHYKQRDDLFRRVKALNGDSFIFNYYRLSLGQFDFYDEYTSDQYVNAQQIYDEFIKVDGSVKRHKSYDPDIMLEITKMLLGDRFKAFDRIYKKQYRIKPISKTRYLEKAQKDLEKVLHKYEMDIAIDKWGDRSKDEVIKAKWIMQNYYRSTGRFDLATAIEKAPIIKPKTFTQLAKIWREFHTPKMAKECKIEKKEANKLLQRIIKNIKQNF